MIDSVLDSESYPTPFQVEPIQRECPSWYDIASTHQVVQELLVYLHEYADKEEFELQEDVPPSNRMASI
jgi:hypothetical protein